MQKRSEIRISHDMATNMIHVNFSVNFVWQKIMQRAGDSCVINMCSSMISLYWSVISLCRSMISVCSSDQPVQ